MGQAHLLHQKVITGANARFHQNNILVFQSNRTLHRSSQLFQDTVRPFSWACQAKRVLDTQGILDTTGPYFSKRDRHVSSGSVAPVSLMLKECHLDLAMRVSDVSLNVQYWRVAIYTDELWEFGTAPRDQKNSKLESYPTYKDAVSGK